MIRADLSNNAMAGALEGGDGGGFAAPVAAAAPAFPPELVQIAFELGLDIRNPEHLAILFQLLGQGAGGGLGPMAGAVPGLEGPSLEGPEQVPRRGGEPCGTFNFRE